MAEHEPRNFIQPCLLLLLRERSDHGYDLADRLRELHAVDGDAGVVYRALRSLEKAGLVRSSWGASDAGPARRTYEVTPLGAAMLDHQASILEDTHRTLHLFRQRYQRLAGCPGVRVGEQAVAGLIGSNGTGPAPPYGAADHGAAGNSAHGAAGNGAAGNGAYPAGTNGGRRNGDGGHGAHGGPGGRGVRPPPIPGQRTGH